MSDGGYRAEIWRGQKAGQNLTESLALAETLAPSRR